MKKQNQIVSKEPAVLIQRRSGEQNLSFNRVDIDRWRHDWDLKLTLRALGELKKGEFYVTRVARNRATLLVGMWSRE